MHYLEKQLHQTANHLGWKFDQFAAEYNLTGQQLSTIDFWLISRIGKVRSMPSK